MSAETSISPHCGWRTQAAQLPGDTVSTMFHPVGHQTTSVYWRRRLFLIASVIALIGLIAVSAHVALSKDPVKPPALPSFV